MFCFIFNFELIDKQKALEIKWCVIPWCTVTAGGEVLILHLVEWEVLKTLRSKDHRSLPQVRRTVTCPPEPRAALEADLGTINKSLYCLFMWHNYLTIILFQ